MIFITNNNTFNVRSILAGKAPKYVTITVKGWVDATTIPKQASPLSICQTDLHFIQFRCSRRILYPITRMRF